MFYIKNTWVRCDDKRVIDMYNRVKEKAKELYPWAFADCEPELYINDSLKFIGRCELNYARSYTTSEYNRAFNTNSIKYRNAFILLSKHSIGMSDGHILNTLCHEFGHYVSPGCKHNYIWKARANKIGESFGQKCERLATTEETEEFHSVQVANGIEYKYKLKCPNCGSTWGYRRMTYAVKNAERCTCTKCHSHLIRVQ